MTDTVRNSAAATKGRWTKARAFLLTAVALLVPVGARATEPPVNFAHSGSMVIVYPLMSPRLSSSFGDRRHPIFKVTKHHNGVDLAAPSGAPIRAIKSGTVVFADNYAGYGNLVVVEHQGNMTSHYGHCSKIIVKPGQRVQAGQVIAEVGRTGNVTGPHLHFELRSGGTPMDPEHFINGLAEEAAG